MTSRATAMFKSRNPNTVNTHTFQPRVHRHLHQRVCLNYISASILMYNICIFNLFMYWSIHLSMSLSIRLSVCPSKNWNLCIKSTVVTTDKQRSHTFFLEPNSRHGHVVSATPPGFVKWFLAMASKFETNPWLLSPSKSYSISSYQKADQHHC